jgi:hypothetical protein
VSRIQDPTFLDLRNDCKRIPSFAAVDSLPDHAGGERGFAFRKLDETVEAAYIHMSATRRDNTQ